MRAIARYFRNLSRPRLLLWCYLLWYLQVVVRYFDPNPLLWATSLGLSVIIGLALYVSTVHASPGGTRLSFWATFRLFLMPFCVSSFAALVKGHHFILIFPPNLAENIRAFGICLLFCAAVLLFQLFRKKGSGADG